MGITSGKKKPEIIGSVKTTSRFASLGWGGDLIGGGMTDGTVHLWSASSLIAGKDKALLSSINTGSTAVSALQFNPLNSSTTLATGTSDALTITSVDVPTNPKQTSTFKIEVNHLAWNTQVEHIVATAGSSCVTIWDLRQGKPWCELRCNNASVLAWNPNQGLNIVTASAEDPTMKLWDLRASTHLPLATLSSSSGILSAAWCPHDDTLIASCAKDNQTLLWDLQTLQPIADIPYDFNMEESFSSKAQQKRHDVQWSPIRKGVLTTCSFDRKVQAHSIVSQATKSGRVPKWMSAAKCGATWSFGNNLVQHANNQVQISTKVEKMELKKAAMELDALQDPIDYSLTKAEKAALTNEHYECQVWGFMQLTFEQNAREHLLQYLGFDADKIHQTAVNFTPQSDESDKLQQMSLNNNSTSSMSKEAEITIQQALLVGNFDAAVECCFRSDNLADALILAACGGTELWAKAQAKYFEKEAKKRPFLSIVNAVLQNQVSTIQQYKLGTKEISILYIYIFFTTCRIDY